MQKTHFMFVESLFILRFTLRSSCLVISSDWSDWGSGVCIVYRLLNSSSTSTALLLIPPSYFLYDSPQNIIKKLINDRRKQNDDDTTRLLIATICTWDKNFHCVPRKFSCKVLSHSKLIGNLIELAQQ